MIALDSIEEIILLHSPIGDAASLDEEDTGVQVAAVEAACGSLGKTPRRMEFSLNLEQISQDLRSIHPPLVFNLVETVFGSQMLESAPALCAALGIPCTGNGALAMALTSDKVFTKMILRGLGLPTPLWVDASHRGSAAALVGRPVIIKPICEDASVGITENALFTPKSEKALFEKLCAAPTPCFAEAYIDGREFNLSLIEGADGVTVCPPAEIVFLDYPPHRPKIVDYAAKWETDSFAYQHTVRTFDIAEADMPLRDAMRSLALDCWHLLNLRGYARVDFRVDSAGKIVILEINANPCLSPDSGFIAACQQQGMDYQQVIGAICHAAG